MVRGQCEVVKPDHVGSVQYLIEVVPAVPKCVLNVNNPCGSWHEDRCVDEI